MEVEASDESDVEDNEQYAGEHGNHDESSHMDNDESIRTLDGSGLMLNEHVQGPLHNPPAPHLSMSKEQFTNMMQAMVQEQMEQQFAMQRHAHTATNRNAE
jgi:hypothetical protein